MVLLDKLNDEKFSFYFIERSFVSTIKLVVQPTTLLAAKLPANTTAEGIRGSATGWQGTNERPINHHAATTENTFARIHKTHNFTNETCKRINTQI